MSAVSEKGRAVMPPDNEDIRIRRVFALAESDPIPRVSQDTLLKYREFLEAALSFPFQALYAETTAPVRRLFRCVLVLGLSETTNRRASALMVRVQKAQGEIEIPLAELGVREDDPNHQLVDDFAYWFWNWR
jgi:hypothetical protein